MIYSGMDASNAKRQQATGIEILNDATEQRIQRPNDKGIQQ